MIGFFALLRKDADRNSQRTSAFCHPTMPPALLGGRHTIAPPNPIPPREFRKNLSLFKFG